MKQILLTLTIAFFISACSDDHLSADQISKMTEEQIKQVTPNQIGKMTPGELKIFDARKNHFSSERTQAEMERARKTTIESFMGNSLKNQK